MLTVLTLLLEYTGCVCDACYGLGALYYCVRLQAWATVVFCELERCSWRCLHEVWFLLS